MDDSLVRTLECEFFVVLMGLCHTILPHLYRSMQLLAVIWLIYHFNIFTSKRGLKLFGFENDQQNEFFEVNFRQNTEWIFKTLMARFNLEKYRCTRWSYLWSIWFYDFSNNLSYKSNKSQGSRLRQTNRCTKKCRCGQPYATTKTEYYLNLQIIKRI